MPRIIDKGIKKKMSRGMILYEQGQEVKEILLLLQGKVRGEDGNERIEINAGGIIGLIDGIRKEYLYQYSLETDSLVLVFPYADFHNEVRELVLVGFSLGVANEMLDCIMGQTRHFYEKYNGLKQKAQQLYSVVKEDYALCEKVSKGCLVPFEISPKIENMVPFDVEDTLLKEHEDYFGSLSTIPMEIRNAFFMANSYITVKHMEDLVMIAGEMEDCYEEAKKYLVIHGERILGEDKENLFSLYTNLVLNIGNHSEHVQLLRKKIDKIVSLANSYEEIEKETTKKLWEQFLERFQMMSEADKEMELPKEGRYSPAQIVEAKKNTSGSLVEIIQYAGRDIETANEFRKAVEEFISLEDKKSSTDKANKLRNTIVQLYYVFYEAIFFRYMEEKESTKIPPSVSMFLDYSFMDQRLITEEQLLELYYLRQEEIEQEETFYPVYTMKEWLIEIYEGRQEPSKNEMDLDYAAYLREEQRSGLITKKEEEELKKDFKGKVHFELMNMLKAANKVTQGQVLTFCPILNTDQSLERMDQLFLSKEKISRMLDQCRNIDYSCFYRPILFWDTEHGVGKEIIMKEVLPITILLPNIGTKALMWQEISGLKKDTPARFAFSLFEREDLERLVVNVIGQFRWEICRTIQGVFWNDIRERSLTSEYFDFAQFYKKNRDLTPLAKDKIRQSLAKARNSFKGLFVQDYVSWILYESKGSSKLNKICREILFQYCPFSKDIREKLRQHPVFQPHIERFDREMEESRKKAKNLESLLIRNKGKITEDLQKYFDYLEL